MDVSGLRDETQRWLEVLRSPREVMDIELTGMIASIAHLAYHLGAIRQINKSVRGPKRARSRRTVPRRGSVEWRRSHKIARHDSISPALPADGDRDL